MATLGRCSNSPRGTEAIWVDDGEISLFLNHDMSSTVLPGKKLSPRWPTVDYSRCITVPCIDFSSWIRRNFSTSDQIIVKMDIEGAEYDVLEKMVAEDTIRDISVLYVEWHAHKFAGLGPERHERLLRSIPEAVEIRPWD